MKKKQAKAARDLDRANILFHIKRLKDLLDNHFENIDVQFTVESKKKKRKPGILKKKLKQAYIESNEESKDDDWEREHSDRMVDDNLNEADN